ncbi:PREDICTED: rab11 family-interacting protein 4 isoform X3 [Vollenhovia emeryi]|uniref:rab11 family-interacting protein 4 isoform X3 n=1 Tax=Vollenhovia emeryi TaxID=411798 RepID=UPI0005F42E45|nr:PREDICTED: rab11 family-interacting protein 4 isoform X3 [Vollenhovia emeryi]
MRSHRRWLRDRVPRPLRSSLVAKAAVRVSRGSSQFAADRTPLSRSALCGPAYLSRASRHSRANGVAACTSRARARAVHRCPEPRGGFTIIRSGLCTSPAARTRSPASRRYTTKPLGLRAAPRATPRNPRSPNSTVGRHSWQRTSLRRTPPCSGKKRLSSNALASQLYRSGSFNSSGIGSNYDPADDVFSDVSLEDVMDLSHKVQMIQEQMDALADTKSVGEERYARAKQENAMLEARILILEESAKDAETRAGEKLHDEQRRFREAKERVERECNLQLENYNTKLKSAETESTGLREEIVRIRDQLNKISEDKTRLENDLREARREADAARESERYAISRTNEAHHMLDAMREELSLRSEDQQRLEELVQQVAQLQARNKSLEESRDELQAAVALQAGRELLMLNPCNNNAEKGPSLAVELLAGMNPDQIDGQEEFSEPCTMAELKQALKEQQEVNTQLRTYIDGILLNIVENYPQLLEVKQTH